MLKFRFKIKDVFYSPFFTLLSWASQCTLSEPLVLFNVEVVGSLSVDNIYMFLKLPLKVQTQVLIAQTNLRLPDQIGEGRVLWLLQ